MRRWRAQKIKYFVEVAGQLHARLECQRACRIPAAGCVRCSSGRRRDRREARRHRIAAGPAACLEVDQPGLFVLNNNILRLEVAVDEHARKGGESRGDLMHPGKLQYLRTADSFESEMGAQTVVKEILLLPQVELLAEFAFEPKTRGRRSRVAAMCSLLAWKSADS